MSIFARSLLVFGSLALGATMNTARADNWPETVLWSFVPPGDIGDQFGYRPQMGVKANNGDLYGSASAGGKNNGGVIYKFANGKMHVLFSFYDQNKRCGFNPSARLVVQSGKIYGTTYQGGQHNVGVIFELDHSSGKWKCNPIWTFVKNPDDKNQKGYSSFGGLIVDPGDPDVFYGTAQFSKTETDSSHVKIDTGGVVFRLVRGVSGWTYTVIHEFKTGSQGKGLVPTGPLTLDGNFLYGATFFGGISDGGVVYKVNKNDTTDTSFEVLHKFNGDATTDDAKFGIQPTQGPLVVDGGFVYGATAFGGTDKTTDPVAGNFVNGGVVFRIPTSGGGTLKLLHSFGGIDNPGKGYSPIGGLTITNGALYGATQFGGGNGGGSIYRLAGSKKNEFTLLFDFDDSNSGFRPSGPLVVTGQETITGTTLLGGSDNAGVIFRLTKP